MNKEIGKIKAVCFGLNEGRLGVSFTFGSTVGGWGVGTFRGFWSPEIEITKGTKWTEADRNRAYAETMRFIAEILLKAKRDDVSRLVGVPVEVTFDGGSLKSWRVLEEAI